MTSDLQQLYELIRSIESIGAIIRAIRGERTQKEFARHVQLDEIDIRNIERGRTVTVTALKRICEAEMGETS